MAPFRQYLAGLDGNQSEAHLTVSEMSTSPATLCGPASRVKCMCSVKMIMHQLLLMGRLPESEQWRAPNNRMLFLDWRPANHHPYCWMQPIDATVHMSEGHRLRGRVRVEGSSSQPLAALQEPE